MDISVTEFKQRCLAIIRRVEKTEHMWVGWPTPESSLARGERDALDRSAEKRELHIAAVSLWEVQLLHAKQH